MSNTRYYTQSYQENQDDHIHEDRTQVPKTTKKYPRRKTPTKSTQQKVPKCQTKSTQEKKSIDKSYQSAFLNRDVENIYSDNFEGENMSNCSWVFFRILEKFHGFAGENMGNYSWVFSRILEKFIILKGWANRLS